MLTGKASCGLLEAVALRVADMLRTSPELEPAQFGKRVAAMLAEEWGGVSVYIPKNMQQTTAERDREIYQAYTGSNVTHLALQYGLSEQRIYIILKRERKKRRPQQLKLL